jgi:hypothetical protein
MRSFDLPDEADQAPSTRTSREEWHRWEAEQCLHVGKGKGEGEVDVVSFTTPDLAGAEPSKAFAKKPALHRLLGDATKAAMLRQRN